MDSFLDFLLPEIMDLLNEEMSDSEQTLVTGQVDPAIQQEQPRNILFTAITWSLQQSDKREHLLPGKTRIRL